MTYIHIALDWKSPAEGRHTCVQLVNRATGKAVGTVNFHNEAVTGLLAVGGVDRVDLLRDALALRKNSIPYEINQ